MREIRTLRATRRGLETWRSRGHSGQAGAPVLDPTALECGIEYEGRSGLIALLHRLGMEHRKPKAIARKLDPAKQAAFIAHYEALLNQLPADEAVMFADAVHRRMLRELLAVGHRRTSQWRSRRAAGGNG